MIFKLSVLAALVAPLVSALTVNQPSQAVASGGSLTFTWQAANGDPATFSVFLKNPTFNSVYGIANSVDASLGTLTLAVPLVPENQQYTIILVPVDNVNMVLAESPSFTIGASTESIKPTSSAKPTTLSLSAVSTTHASSTRVSTLILPSSSTGFGVTVSNTQASSASTATAASSGAASVSSTPASSAALPVRFNMNMGVVASMVLSVIAGAAVVAL